MKTVHDISYLSLFLGYSLLIIPFVILWYYKTGLLKSGIISILRMTIQLFAVGFYLEYIFKLNNSWLNSAWLIVMSIISAQTTIKSCKLSFKLFFIPIFFAGLISIVITDAFFLGIVIKLDNIFDAQYLIPITGMLLGNTLKTIIVAIDSYYGKMQKEINFYRWHLANGATHSEAKAPFMKEALKIAFNPLLATTAVMGLISLPGMMTGQILGGSSPNVAIKYQIMLMITIFASSIISVILTLYFSDKFVFDNFGNLNQKLFNQKQSFQLNFYSKRKSKLN